MVDAGVRLGLRHHKAAEGLCTTFRLDDRALGVEPIQQLADLRHRVVHAHPAIEARCAAQGRRGFAANPYRYFAGHRKLAGGREAVEGVVRFRHAVFPEILHHLQHRVHALAAVTRVVAQHGNLILAPAGAHAKHEPIVCLHGKRGGLFCRAERLAHGQHIHVGHEAQLFRHCGHGGDGDHRVGKAGVGVDMALPGGVHSGVVAGNGHVIRHRNAGIAHFLRRRGDLFYLVVTFVKPGQPILHTTSRVV